MEESKAIITKEVKDVPKAYQFLNSEIEKLYPALGMLEEVLKPVCDTNVITTTEEKESITSKCDLAIGLYESAYKIKSITTRLNNILDTIQI